MKIGEILRYEAKQKRSTSRLVGGLTNFYVETELEGATQPLLERGISPIGPVRIPGAPTRIPAVLIRSSPAKAGSTMTPWADYFDSDHGHIRYFGDNKSGGKSPDEAPGNRVLNALAKVHMSRSPEERLTAVPVVFFRGVALGGKVKGFIRFHGLGVIERVGVVSQWDSRTKQSFANYQYDFAVLDLARENETFDWTWINLRRQSQISDASTLKAAPYSWREWVKSGHDALPRLVRNVARLHVTKRSEQLPEPASADKRLLDAIYQFYKRREARFEGLAELVAERVLGGSGARYVRGWLTKRSGDGGTDFVGRLDLGDGFARTSLVVLGQAKCEIPTQPTGGRDVARTVARLRRGWVGVYVTTSFFSEPVQMEIAEDQYPIVLIHGARLAEEVGKMIFDARTDVQTFLKSVDDLYDSRILQRRPEEILL